MLNDLLSFYVVATLRKRARLAQLARNQVESCYRDFVKFYFCGCNFACTASSKALSKWRLASIATDCVNTATSFMYFYVAGFSHGEILEN